MIQEEKDTTNGAPEERPAESAAEAPAAEAERDVPEPAPEEPAAEGREPAPARQPAPAETEPQRPTAGERREGDGQRPERRAERPRRRFGRRKVCAFCVEKATSIDYKDAAKLRRYLSDRGRMESRRKTGTCAKHQRWLATALKRARHLALLPYTPEHIRVSGTFTTRR